MCDPMPLGPACKRSVWECWPSYNQRDLCLHSPGLGLTAASCTEPGQGRSRGWSQPGRRPLPPPPVRPRLGARQLALCASGSTRPHLVGPHLGQGTVYTTPALHFSAELSFPPMLSPPPNASAASTRSPRPAHAQAQLTSWLRSSAIGQCGPDTPEKAFLSGSAAYTVVKSAVLSGSGRLRGSSREW